jgi:hypothetical protein
MSVVIEVSLAGAAVESKNIQMTEEYCCIRISVSLRSDSRYGTERENK